MDRIKKVAVIGSGTMGNGIVHVSALSGFDTIMMDIQQKALDQALLTINNNMDRQINKNIITEQSKQQAIDRIQATIDYANIIDCDIVIESVFEKKEIKQSVIEQVSKLVTADCIIASNTSSVPLTEIASYAKRPERVIGMHFFNPVPVMELVEIIKALQTNAETYEVVKELAVKMGKTPIRVNDSAGFVTSRLIMMLINEAICALHEGVASADDIDVGMKLAMNHPMGPLALADFIGLDVCLGVLDTMYTSFGDPKYRPSPLLKKMVSAGYLGRKTKKGFYEYE